MQKSLRMIERSIGKILDYVGIIIGFIIIIIALIISFSVIGRNISIPIHWSDPISIYLFLGSSYLAVAYAMYKKEHIHVDILIIRFPMKFRKYLEFVWFVIMIFLFTYISKNAYTMMLNSYSKGATDLSYIKVPVWIPQLFLVISFILLIFAMIRHLIILIIREANEGKMHR